MSDGSELQNEEMYLPGNLGTIKCFGKERDIQSVFRSADGSVTITIAATEPKPLMIDGHKTGLAFYSPEIEIERPKESIK